MSNSKFHDNDLSHFGRYAPRGAVARLLDLTRNASGSWAGRKGAFFLRSMAMKAMKKGRPLDVEALGARMRLYPSHNHCESRLLFTPQYFDLPEREILRARMPEDVVFIDVGANIGGYSLFAAASAGLKARILAIEPRPDIFERLVYNIDQNSFATIKALACAIADRDGDMLLFVDSPEPVETTSRIGSVSRREQQITVPVKSLANLVTEEGLRRIDVLKLDVEGAENLILEPFFRDMPESLWPRFLFIEFAFEPMPGDSFSLVAGQGYRPLLKSHQKVIYERS
ncbi:FkbM family methyltransferase [Beijerinckia indica]|nr:FkbM family methyltransferase [Beijerinckia indica]